MSLQPDGGDGTKDTAPKLPPEPKRPESNRRNLGANLKSPLYQAVLDIMLARGQLKVDNHKRFRDADLAERDKPLADKVQEANRADAAGSLQNLNKVKDQRALAATAATDKGGEESALAKSRPKKKARTDPGEYVEESVTGFVKDGRKLDVYPQGNRRGAVTEVPGELFALNPGSKVGEQVLQLLGHLSQVFMNKVNDMEYQSMLVNNRVLIAANAQTAIGAFKDTALQEYLAEAAKIIRSVNEIDATARAYKAGAVAEALKAGPGAPLTAQQTDGAELLGDYQFGHHVDHGSRKDLQSVLNVLQHQAKQTIKMLGPMPPEAAAKHVAGDADKFAAILVETPTQTGWHAEQALAMTLVAAGWTGGASVAGTKNPCMVCWLTLNLLPQCGYPLTALQTPGFYWTAQTVPALTHVAKGLGIPDMAVLKLCFEAAQVFTDNGFRQFVTALVAQDNVQIDPAVLKDLFDAHQVSQSQSRGSFSATRNPGMKPEALKGKPFTDPAPDRVGDYGTPPGSPGGQADREEEEAYDKSYAEWKEAAEKAKKDGGTG